MDYAQYLAWLKAGGTPTVVDDTLPPHSDDDAAKAQFNAQFSVADLCDAMQAFMAGDQTQIQALLARRQQIQASVAAASAAKLQAKVQG